MRTPLYVLLSTLTFCVPCTLHAQTAVDETDAQEKDFYRVEAIVFTHAGGQSDEWPLENPTDHSDAIDPAWRAFAREQRLERAEEKTSVEDSDLSAALNVVDAIAELESGEQSLGEVLLYPDPWLALDELSEPMQRAASRLERSGAYRVQASLAWHQGLDRTTPRQAVRIHDDRILEVNWIKLTPTGRLLRDDRPVRAVSDLAPAFKYRLDGTIRLRERQFMHADVDLGWRVRERVGPAAWPLLTADAEFSVHRLDQSRTIRSDRFEYFDSDWLGLLLRVSRYELKAEDPAAENQDSGPDSP